MSKRVKRLNSKRLLIQLLITALVLSFTVGFGNEVTFAASKRVSLNVEYCSSGSHELVVAVKISGNTSGFDSIDYLLEYPEEYCKLIKAETGSAIELQSGSYNRVTFGKESADSIKYNNPCEFVCALATGKNNKGLNTNNGVLAKYTFSIEEDISDDIYEFKIKDAHVSYYDSSAASAATVNLKSEIKNFRVHYQSKYDYDGSGFIDENDVKFIRNNINTVSNSLNKSFDIDSDGFINETDVEAFRMMMGDGR